MDELSLWEIVACADAHAAYHGAEETPDPPSEEDFFADIEKHAWIMN